MLTYTAPERLVNPQIRNVATDIYEIGILLYELVFGLPPFQH